MNETLVDGFAKGERLFVRKRRIRDEGDFSISRVSTPGFLGFLRLCSSPLGCSSLPPPPIHRRPRDFLQDSHATLIILTSMLRASLFYVYKLYVHPARLRDFDIMNIRLGLCLLAVLDAANILIRDTCPRCSKKYLTDKDYHRGNRIKRFSLRFRAKTRSERH